MATLKDRAEKDMQQHNAEMKELIRVIDYDRRLREFMNVKSKEREEDEQLVAWRVRKGLSASSFISICTSYWYIIIDFHHKHKAPSLVTMIWMY